MGKEYELKFTATPQIQDRILQDYPGETAVYQMETTYYDTPDSTLSRKNCTLRLRMENGRPVCTLKTPGVGIERQEWETECSRIQDALVKIRAQGAPLGELAPVAPICAAAFTRRARLLSVPGGTVELACDAGVLRGGSSTVPLCEIEIELKSGPHSAADAFAAVLAETYGLRVEPLSKFARARALSQEVPHV